MEAIADEAGVSKQTLYRHFETKVDLLGAVVTSELMHLSQRARLPASVEDPTRLRSVLLQFSNALVKTVLRPETLALIHLLVGEMFQIPSLRDSLVEQVPAGWFDQLGHVASRRA
jgi:AcrR family transcriptional regulator